jgi:hypothetical protein
VAPLHETNKVHHVGYHLELVHQLVAWQESQDSPDRMDSYVHGLDQMSAAGGSASVKGSRGQLPLRPSQAGGANIPRLGASMRRT